MREGRNDEAALRSGVRASSTRAVSASDRSAPNCGWAARQRHPAAHLTVNGDHHAAQADGCPGRDLSPRRILVSGPGLQRRSRRALPPAARRDHGGRGRRADATHQPETASAVSLALRHDPRPGNRRCRGGHPRSGPSGLGLGLLPQARARSRLRVLAPGFDLLGPVVARRGHGLGRLHAVDAAVGLHAGGAGHAISPTRCRIATPSPATIS